MVTRSLPRISGEVVVTGLSAHTDIFRDDLHVPHILSQSETDGFFAQGFVTAQDRFWQMDLNRRIVRGQLGVVYGSAALHTDSLMVDLGLFRQAETILEHIPTESQTILQAYTDGINAYLIENTNSLPIEFRLLDYQPDPWNVLDCVSLLCLYFWEKDSNWRSNMVYHAVADQNRHETVSKLFPGKKTGSLTKNKTVSVERLDAVFGEKFIPVSTGMDWAGFIPGKHTQSGDPHFLLRPTFAPQQPAQWFEINLISPDWNIHGLSLPGFPGVLLGHNGQIAWASMAPESGESLAGTQFLLNFIPLLFSSHTSTTIKDIQDKKEGRFLSRGLMLADSNGLSADVFKKKGRVLSGEEKTQHGLLNPILEQRLNEILIQGGKLSPRQIDGILTDQKSLFARQIVQSIQPVLETWQPQTLSGKQIQKEIQNWNFENKAGSREALVFQVFLSSLLQDLARQSLDSVLAAAYLRLETEPLSLLNHFLEQNPDPQLIHRALNEAVRTCETRFGSDPSAWAWAGYRKSRIESAMNIHPLLTMVYTIGPLAMGGSRFTIQGNAHTWADPGKVVHGPSARLVFNLNHLGKSRMGLPSGQSGQPLDSHYSDQVQHFLAGKLHPMLTDTSRIRHAGWKKLTLKPRY